MANREQQQQQQQPVRRSERAARPSTRYGPEFEAFRRPLTRAPTTPVEEPAAGSSRQAPAARARAPAVDRAQIDFVERGQTRSGARFAARNLPYYQSVRQLLSHHGRLLELGPVVNSRYVRVGPGTLEQTCIRFRSDHPDLRNSLTRVLADLFRAQTSDFDGFEVSITFNAILRNREGTSFSLFYGQNYGQSGQSRLGYSEPTVIRNLLHLRRVPTEFDLEELTRRFNVAFDSSDLFVARILNVVYLVHQFTQQRQPSSSRLN